MKITAVYAAAPNYPQGLDKALSIVKDTLEELGDQVETIHLWDLSIPYYDGIASSGVSGLIKSIGESDGVILAATAVMDSACPLFLTLMEHLSSPDYNAPLSGKNCFLLAAGLRGGERGALQQMSSMVGYLGGSDPVRTGLSGHTALTLENDPALKETIERQAEDFFRIIRQNRKLLIPSYYGQGASQPVSPKKQETKTTGASPEKNYGGSISDLYKKLNLNEIDDEQAKDINEITQFFAQKYKKTDNGGIQAGHVAPVKKDFTKTEPKLKNCHQLTKNLPHYFNPQLAAGLNAVIQINVTGEESFEGYLTIDNTNCDFEDGQAENPEIAINVDSKVWTDILKGKYSTQKAFMVGQVKVRGNFLLVTKFDQLFNAMA